MVGGGQSEATPAVSENLESPPWNPSRDSGQPGGFRHHRCSRGLEDSLAADSTLHTLWALGCELRGLRSLPPRPRPPDTPLTKIGVPARRWPIPAGAAFAAIVIPGRPFEALQRLQTFQTLWALQGQSKNDGGRSGIGSWPTPSPLKNDGLGASGVRFPLRRR